MFLGMSVAARFVALLLRLSAISILIALSLSVFTTSGFATDINSFLSHCGVVARISYSTLAKRKACSIPCSTPRDVGPFFALRKPHPQPPKIEHGPEAT